MIQYSTVEMLLLNKKWIEEHGDHWAAGRIEVYGYNTYGFEYPLSPMHRDDWNAFSYWLEEMQTEELWPYEKLIEHFQYWYGKEVRWIKL